MMNTDKTLLLFVLTIFMFSCTKKKKEFDVVQDLCEKIKIDSPDYEVLNDPCDGTTLEASFEISFDFDGDDECLYAIVNSPVFYTKNNDEISNVSFESKILESGFTRSGDKVTYIFAIQFSSLSEAQLFNHMILDFRTENEIENKSNTLQIRLNTRCSKVDPSTYEVNPDKVIIPPSQSFFNITLWDNASEDGDIVSVYLNERWIIENHTLLNDSTSFNFSTDLLVSGENDLVVFALNEGTSGPNTMSIAINGEEIKNFQPGLLTGEAVRIDF